MDGDVQQQAVDFFAEDVGPNDPRVRFAERMVQRERERCAVLCEEVAGPHGEVTSINFAGAKQCAMAIRLATKERLR